MIHFVCNTDAATLSIMNTKSDLLIKQTSNHWKEDGSSASFSQRKIRNKTEILFAYRQVNSFKGSYTYVCLKTVMGENITAWIRDFNAVLTKTGPTEIGVT